MNRLVSAGTPHLILSSHSFVTIRGVGSSALELVLGFFWYPDGPAPPLETESDSALSLGLLRVGGTLAVVGTEGLCPAWLLVPLVVGVEDTEVTTGGAEVEA